MTQKKKMYISLPISGHPLEEVKAKAEEYAETARTLGWEPVTPFDVCPEDGKPYSWYMGKDIEALLECDAIMLVPGWSSSKGCRAELAVAQVYDKKVFRQYFEY